MVNSVKPNILIVGCAKDLTGNAAVIIACPNFFKQLVCVPYNQNSIKAIQTMKIVGSVFRKGRQNLFQVGIQFSHSVMSDSLRPHELQHARPPCPSPTPGVHPNPCLSSR